MLVYLDTILHIISFLREHFYTFLISKYQATLLAAALLTFRVLRVTTEKNYKSFLHKPQLTH